MLFKKFIRKGGKSTADFSQEEFQPEVLSSPKKHFAEIETREKSFLDILIINSKHKVKKFLEKNYKNHQLQEYLKKLKKMINVVNKFKLNIKLKNNYNKKLNKS